MPKFIRKQSLLSKIRSYPFDTYLHINESAKLIDWDNHAKSIAIPIGTILTSIFFIACSFKNHRYGNLFKNQNDLFIDSRYKQIRQRAISSGTPKTYDRKWDYILNFLILSLWTLSLLNFVIWLMRSKRYDLFGVKEKPANDNAFRVIVDTNNDTWLNKIGRVIGINPNYSEGGERELWGLSVWNPSLFSTYLSISFSPLSLLIISQNCTIKLFLIVLLMNWVNYIIVIKKFSNLIKDKELIHRETFKEYDSKFVRPKLSIIKKNVTVDATKGATLSSSRISSPSLREKVFITHDINGVPINNVALFRKKIEYEYRNSPLSQQRFTEDWRTPVKPITPMRNFSTSSRK